MSTNVKETAPVVQPVPEVQDESRTIEQIQLTYERNKKPIMFGIIAVVAAAAIYFGYFGWYKTSQNEKAAAKVFYAEQMFAADSPAAKILNGDGGRPGVLKIMRDYSGTKTANLCHYYAGIAYLKSGEFKKAVDQLEDFDGKGTTLEYAAYGKIGDAYMELKNAAKATDYYKKATGNKEDLVQTPMYLMSLGTAAEIANKPEDAKAAYKRIRDEYPQSMQARDVDRHLARLGELE